MLRLLRSDLSKQRLSAICTVLTLCVDDSEGGDSIGETCSNLRRQGRWKPDEAILRAMLLQADAAELANAFDDLDVSFMARPTLFRTLFHKAYEQNRRRPAAIARMGVALALFLVNHRTLARGYGTNIREMLARPRSAAWTSFLQCVGMLPDLGPEEVAMVRRALCSRQDQVLYSALRAIFFGLQSPAQMAPSLRAMVWSPEVRAILTRLSRRGQQDEIGFYAGCVLRDLIAGGPPDASAHPAAR